MSDDFPAFPFEYENENGVRFSHNGMTLRDWFAGQALSGGVRSTVPDYELSAMFGKGRTGSIRREEIMAADAYRISDAMLAARDAKPSKD